MTTPATLQTLKQRGEKIAMLTCYDASFAALMRAAGVDVLLVGDSMGKVLQGAQDTIGVTMQDMLYHTRCVAAGTKSLPIIADMPFTSDATPEIALSNALRLIAAGAHMVKLEGNKPDIVRHLVANDIAVCGHLGFTPQSMRGRGDYAVQGQDPKSAQQLEEEAMSLQQAGIGLLVLSMLPSALAARISVRLRIPTIGIGAGAECDGQVQVLHDILGISSSKTPKFSRNFLSGGNDVQGALAAYASAVKSGTFPAVEHSF
jgi:3-methyl-2-oxobutanoate hydroxymethyltransferase